jgi:hypothetical protein
MVLRLTTNIILFLLLFSQTGFGQEVGYFSGGFEAASKLFMKDEKIGAENTPQYDRQLIGSEAWLDLKFSQSGFDLAVRFDLFNNTNLEDPLGSFTGQGIGMWYISKQLDKLGITVGHIYDQIGSGIIFRAYESRPQLIDNALLGGRLTYYINDDWSIKAFTGKQKVIFDTYGSIIKGASIEGYLSFGEENPLSLAPGIGLINRTHSDDIMDNLVSVLQTYIESDRVIPTYNVYAYSIYNTLTIGPITWYAEGAYKTEDVFFDPNELRTNSAGGQTPGKYVKRNGSVLYSSISYAKNKLGISLEGKRTKNFTFRSDPLLRENDGLISFIPPMLKENTYRLLTRYSPATQEIGELGFQVDVGYAINKSLSFNVNFDHITDLDNELLYREIYAEAHYKKGSKWHIIGGLQIQNYNQQVYEIKANAPLVKTITPFVEYQYKFSRKNSVRIESQYMKTDQDFGSWIFTLVEFGMAPHWSFGLSGMYNIEPKKNDDKILYPTLGVYYTKNANRYSMRYVKQVEGVVCTGGICRLEPAFSGFQLDVVSTF